MVVEPVIMANFASENIGGHIPCHFVLDVRFVTYNALITAQWSIPFHFYLAHFREDYKPICLFAQQVSGQWCSFLMIVHSSTGEISAPIFGFSVQFAPPTHIIESIEISA